jgi:hypothetical protein
MNDHQRDGQPPAEGLTAPSAAHPARIGINDEDREPGVAIPPVSSEQAANADAFFQYTFLAVRRYRLNFVALAAAPTRIVVAGGRGGRASRAYRGAVAVAERLGTPVVAFPGDHMAYRTHPRAFAARLREVLGAERGADRPRSRLGDHPP